MGNKIIIVSGFFNPIHIGHLEYINNAKTIGDKLIVIVNNDTQVGLKGSVPFMKQEERVEILKNLKAVDKVFLSIDLDMTVCRTLESLRERYINDNLIFAKGGDSTKNNVPELEICKVLDIEVVFGIGGKKIQSSSWLLGKQ